MNQGHVSSKDNASVGLGHQLAKSVCKEEKTEAACRYDDDAGSTCESCMDVAVSSMKERGDLDQHKCISNDTLTYLLLQWLN